MHDHGNAACLIGVTSEGEYTTCFQSWQKERGAEYPPLTSLEEYPLHGWNYGHYYACQGGPDTQYDWRCPDCIDIAETYLEEFGDFVVEWKLNAETDARPVSARWLIKRSRSLGVR